MSEPVAENTEINILNFIRELSHWRLIQTADGWGMVLEAGGKVFAFPLERAQASRILDYFTNEEYSILPPLEP